VKHLFLLLAACMLTKASYAQTNTITGKTLDEAGQAVEFVSLSLVALPDSNQVASQTSNDHGAFQFTNIPKGNYAIIAYQVGFLKAISAPLSVEANETKTVTLSMKALASETEEVTVEGQRPPVRQEPDKMVVDVENSVSNSGLNTLDVLRKSPGISVGRDGNLSIKGRSGVQVMIDDKTLYMSESQLASLLKSIPSDQLKEIEIITSPSAKYDAVGSSGIINIKLKKAAYEGLTGSWNSSYGQGFYYKSNSGINVAYKKKKLTLNAGYQYNNNREMDKGLINRTYLDPNDSYQYLRSNGTGSGTRQNHNALLNGDYKINKNQSITYDINGAIFETVGGDNGISVLTKKTGTIKNSTVTNNTGRYGNQNLGASLGYKAKLDTNGTTLNTQGNYNRFTSGNNRYLHADNFDSTGQNTFLPYLFHQKMQQSTDQFSLKMDFTKLLAKDWKMESGLKMNNTINQFHNQLDLTENGNKSSGSTDYLYDEKVYAAYTMLNGKWKKWKAQVGLRLENTQIFGRETSLDTAFSRNYTNLFPSGNLSYSFNKNNMVTFLYSRRIKRPEAYHLNPVVSPQDPYNSWGGNPYLLAQYSDNLELNYSMFQGVLIASLTYAHNSNHISYALVTDPATLKTRSTFLNMKKRDVTGFSLTANTSVTKWWSTSNFLNLFYTQFEGGQGNENLNYAQGAWSATSTQSFKLPKEFSLELSGNYDSPKAQNAFGQNLETWQLNAGLSKKLWAGKGLVKVAASDMFWKSRWATESTVNNTLLMNEWKEDTRVLMFTFTYKFGNKLRITQEKDK
jgi:iron complex outermembrane recepter protein